MKEGVCLLLFATFSRFQHKTRKSLLHMLDSDLDSTLKAFKFLSNKTWEVREKFSIVSGEFFKTLLLTLIKILPGRERKTFFLFVLMKFNEIMKTSPSYVIMISTLHSIGYRNNICCWWLVKRIILCLFMLLNNHFIIQRDFNRGSVQNGGWEKRFLPSIYISIRCKVENFKILQIRESENEENYANSSSIDGGSIRFSFPFNDHNADFWTFYYTNFPQKAP